MTKQEEIRRLRQLQRLVERLQEIMKDFLNKWRPTEGRTLSSREEADMNLDWEKIKDMKRRMDKESEELGLRPKDNYVN